MTIINKTHDQVLNPATGAYVRVVEVYANTAEITAGVSPDDFFPGSVMINTQTGDAYLLTELTDGTKSWTAM